MTRRARIAISCALLHQLLDLPDWIKIERVTQPSDSFSRDQFEVQVLGRFLPELKEGEEPQYIQPLYRSVKGRPARLQSINGLDT